MSFLYGFLGALLMVGLLVGGAVIGWHGHRVYVEKTTHAPEPVEGPDAEELQRLKEGQQAFRQLSNYTAEVAYGLNRDILGGDGR